MTLFPQTKKHLPYKVSIVLLLIFSCILVKPTQAKAIIKGVVFSPGDMPTAEVKSKLIIPFAIESTRSWYTVHWDVLPVAADFKKYQQLKSKAGVAKTVVVFNPPVGSDPIFNYESVKAWFAAAATNANGSIDYWEIFNEPNLKKFWKGSLEDYVEIVKAASKALHAQRQYVICGSIAGDPSDLQKLKDLGAFNYCDGISFHPYGSTIADHEKLMKQAKVIVGTKPLYITEWNYRGNKEGTTSWANHLNDLMVTAQKYAAGVWYYRSIGNSETSGTSALLKQDSLKPNEPFYSVLRKIYTQTQ